MNAHRKHLTGVLEKGRALGKSHLYGGEEVPQRCGHLSAEWEDLEGACEKRATHLNKAVTREQVV